MKTAILTLLAYLSSPAFRAKAIVYSAAGLSLFDVGSDVFSISSYFSVGRTGIACALLSTILASYGLQAVIVWYVHRHRGNKALAREIAFVLCGFKPLVDTSRLLGGAQFVGAPVDTKTERLCCELIEMVCEAIPAAVIQINDVLQGSEPSLATLLSISASCIIIAVMSTGAVPEVRCQCAARLARTGDAVCRGLLRRYLLHKGRGRRGPTAPPTVLRCNSRVAGYAQDYEAVALPRAAHARRRKAC